VLGDMESRWNLKDTSGGVMARVKRLRTVILPDMMAGRVTPEEARREAKARLGDVVLSEARTRLPTRKRRRVEKP